MTLDFFVLLAVGAAAGGFMSGLAGFGTSLFALGFWLQIMSPAEAVPIAVVLSVTSGLQGVWIVRLQVFEQPRRLARFLVPAIVGIPLGVGLLALLEASVLKLVIAGFLILYGGFFSLRTSLPEFTRPTPVADALVGFFGGILGGAASLSGALPTMWCSMRPWRKSETRAVLQPFNVVVLGLSAALFAYNGAYNMETLIRIASALPVTLIFAQIGISVFRRMTDGQFRRLIIGLMFVSGLVLLFGVVF
ncbi:MAG: sulfite exporter TauE/SafE family protein [Halocynthiibacter sp.]